jgi:hypothetical protein
MKTKLLIFVIALLIFSFKISSLARADYTCTWSCPDGSSYTDGGYCSDLSAPGDPIDGTCDIGCSGTPCGGGGGPLPTSAPPDSGPCAGPYGYYSGSAACCSYLTACPNGQCLDSCPGPTPTPTNSPGQICTPNSIQYVCGSTTCSH